MQGTGLVRAGIWSAAALQRPGTPTWQQWAVCLGWAAPGAGLLCAPGKGGGAARHSPAAACWRRAARAPRATPGRNDLARSQDYRLITLPLANSPGVFLPQLRGYCLRLRQLPQADLREGRLPDGVLLSLQADMAPQPDLRHGPPAKGADAPRTDQAHVGPQLRTGVWAGYGSRVVGYWVLRSCL